MHVTIKDIYRNIVKTQTKAEMSMTLCACHSLLLQIYHHLQSGCELSWWDFNPTVQCPFCTVKEVLYFLEKNPPHVISKCENCPLKVQGLNCDYYRPKTARVSFVNIFRLGQSDTRIDIHNWWTKTFHEFEWLAEELQTLLQEK